MARSLSAWLRASRRRKPQPLLRCPRLAAGDQSVA